MLCPGRGARKGEKPKPSLMRTFSAREKISGSEMEGANLAGCGRENVLEEDVAWNRTC